MNKEKINFLLYYDELGIEVGLDEVQLLAPPPVDRIADLIELLKNEDKYIAYQASLILTAWNIDEGINKIQEIIDEKFDANFSFETHRISERDNTYDVIAEAIYLNYISGGNKQRVETLFKKLLSKYPFVFFESRFKHALLNFDCRDFIKDIELVFEKTIKNNSIFQASQLLPIIAKYDSAYNAWRFINEIQQYVSEPDYNENIAEALRYLPVEERSKKMLNYYLKSDNYLIKKRAEESIQFLGL